MAIHTKRALIVFADSWRTRIRDFRDRIRQDCADWKFDFQTEQQYRVEKVDYGRYNVVVVQSQDDLRTQVLDALRDGDPVNKPERPASVQAAEQDTQPYHAPTRQRRGRPRARTEEANG